MTDQTKDAMVADCIIRLLSAAPQERHDAGVMRLMSNAAKLLDRLARENERLRVYGKNNEILAEEHFARAERLAEALRYMVQVREIKCEHKHPPPDDFCAKCKADTALATLSPKAGTE